MRRLSVTVLALLLLVSNVSSQSPSSNRAQVISNIFQIPIQTLTAVSNFAQNTRPLGEIIQRRRNPQFQPQRPIVTTTQSQTQSPYVTNNYYRSRAARIAGLYTAPDGSGFRI